jgi:hypothetical protein
MKLVKQIKTNKKSNKTQRKQNIHRNKTKKKSKSKKLNKCKDNKLHIKRKNIDKYLQYNEKYLNRT